ncbi:FAD/NAD(P)-binding domain-containing protein [Melanomma pulvis-pyrius CBS 109.77]|uniref:FAD/NAD(P)-binding domain-containing protein n=1 Tax=Melanomma pulvis-pyrius CBS 109.77 TaxID=1314802 RepID=A0A6A6XK14_9PLEO|nr:FAD/NAD(P)-binding domain-containing protein [Melanomma pulvis-pyrius CBS 109.77]
MSKLNVLISGGGIAGPCLAWWLNKSLSANVTILERAPSPRTSGQAVDIRECAVDVVKRMGLIDTIKSKNTTEEGISFIYADGKTKATFPASGDQGNQSLTSEFEILRGDLAEIFYNVTKDMAEYVFDESVAGVEEQGNGKVRVTFANHLRPMEYDLVVGADGMVSNTRRVVWGRGPGENDYLKSLGQYCSFFTIPKTDDDTKFAQVFNIPGGRIACLRPDQYGETRAYLAVTDGDMSRFDGIKKAMGEGLDAQKKWLENEFVGAEWQTERLVKGMMDSKDFYMQQTAQVKIEEGFTRSRVALLGDAGYCPSPISGMGTSTAIVGAYVLAGELSKSPDDIPKALEQYQTALKPFVEQVQKLIPGAPQIANPQTKLGISAFNTVMGIASSSWAKWIASAVGSVVPSALLSSIGANNWSPPEYPALAV